jgi:hypothetical protein
MAALVAIRFNAAMKEKYLAFIVAGKPPKVALTAIMRKLAIIANALLRNQREWTQKLADQIGSCHSVLGVLGVDDQKGGVRLLLRGANEENRKPAQTADFIS